MVPTHSGGGPSAVCSLWTSIPIISSRNILTGFCLESEYPVYGSDDMVHKITYSHLCASTLCTLQFPPSVYKLLSAGFICLYHAPVLTVNISEQSDRGVEDKTMVDFVNTWKDVLESLSLMEYFMLIQFRICSFLILTSGVTIFFFFKEDQPFLSIS